MRCSLRICKDKLKLHNFAVSPLDFQPARGKRKGKRFFFNFKAAVFVKLSLLLWGICSLRNVKASHVSGQAQTDLRLNLKAVLEGLGWTVATLMGNTYIYIFKGNPGCA